MFNPVMAAFMNVLATSGTAIGPEAWKSVIDGITAQISVSSIVGVLASLVTAGVGLVFLWWGVRKAVGSIMSAFRSGKMSI